MLKGDTVKQLKVYFFPLFVAQRSYKYVTILLSDLVELAEQK